MVLPSPEALGTHLHTTTARPDARRKSGAGRVAPGRASRGEGAASVRVRGLRRPFTGQSRLRPGAGGDGGAGGARRGQCRDPWSAGQPDGGPGALSVPGGGLARGACPTGCGAPHSHRDRGHRAAADDRAGDRPASVRLRGKGLAAVPVRTRACLLPRLPPWEGGVAVVRAYLSAEQLAEVTPWSVDAIARSSWRVTCSGSGR
jgi:hypothetical protein